MFELFFKYSRATFDRGELLFASGWPLWLLVALSVLGAAGVAAGLLRSRQDLHPVKIAVLGLLQTLVWTGLLIMLWQPALLTQTLKPQENSVAVLLDTSASMSYGEAGRSRLQDAILSLNDGALPALQASFNVDLYAFADSSVALESLQAVPAPGPTTRIGDAILSLLRGSNAGALAAIVLVSDGADNSNELGAAQIAEIASFGVPVHTLGVGREAIPEDIELEDVILPPQGTPGSTISAQVSIRHARAALVQLKVYDGDAILASEAVQLPEQGGVTTRWIDLDVGATGVSDLRFTVDALGGETDVVNNTQLRPMEVPQRRRNVLYLEGEPRWEYKFIRRAIDEDGPLRVASLLRTTPNKFYRQGIESPDELGDGFPSDEESLFAYDAIIIGSFEAAALTEEQQTMLAEFVSRRGGSLLMLGGRRGLADGGWGATPLADALPAGLPLAEAASFIRYPAKAKLTEAGARSLLTRFDPDDKVNEALWDELPELADFQYIQAQSLKPAAETLLEADIQGALWPLLVHQRYGLGHSYIFATGGSWRWQMQLPHEDMRHETFWRQLLQALTATAPERVMLSSEQVFYGDERTVKLRADVRDKDYRPKDNATVNVTVEKVGEPSRTLPMTPVPGTRGRYELDFDAEQTGVYRFEATATVEAPDAAFGVSPTPPAELAPEEPGELEPEQPAPAVEELGRSRLAVRRQDGVAEHFHIQQNRALLERLANATGGRYFSLAAASDIPEAVQFSDAGIVERQILDLWNMPINFLILLLAKASEWLLRLRWGRL